MGIVMEMLCKIRAGIIHFLYTKILKKYFFLFDPEDIHEGMTKMGSDRTLKWNHEIYIISLTIVRVLMKNRN